jgi:hypothetical protein
MTSLTLNIDLADEPGIHRAITALQRLLGNAIAPSPLANHPVGASGTGTARTGGARGQTGAVSGPAAGSAQGQQQGSTAATGEAGNAAGSAGQPAGATAASSGTPVESRSVSFDEVKKAFLALSTKPNGRALCEGVLKPFNLGKLSEAKADQYGAVLVEIQKAAAIAS